jgi:hypothetical protein
MKYFKQNSIHPTDKILVLIILVLVILGSMFALQTKRLIRQEEIIETNLPDVTVGPAY